MNLKKALETYNLNKTLIFGWYGGGNFGDELLLSILITLLDKQGYKNLYYIYLNNDIKKLLNQNYTFGEPVSNAFQLIQTIFKVKNIIIGGGGHWGLDMNKNVFLMSVIMFFSHFILRKNIYLFGVGYYNSTNRWGHISAWLVGKSAKCILARDKETFENFSKVNKKVTYLDKDMAFSLSEMPEIIDEQDYDKVLNAINVSEIKKTILVCIRKMKGDRGIRYQNVIEELIAKNPDKTFLLIILEPRETNEDTYKIIEDLRNNYKNVLITDLRFSPLELIKFLKINSREIIMIAPQYHAQLIAHIVEMKHFPIVYDNKVRELLNDIGIEKTTNIEDVTVNELQNFIDVNL